MSAHFLMTCLIFSIVLNSSVVSGMEVDADDDAKFRAWLYEIAPPPDPEALARMMERAERHADPEAMYWIYSAYQRQLLPMTHEDKSVLQLLERAADGGDAKAQSALAYMLAMGIDLPRDEERANDLFRSALAAEEPHAFLTLGRFYLFQGEQGDQRALAGAVVLLEKAAELGHQRAWAMLAHGRGLQDEWERAHAMAEKSAASGDPAGHRILGLMYLYGKGVERDVEIAIQWLKNAAEGGELDAYRELAAIYQSGDDVPADPAEALRWYRRAAETGDHGARLQLVQVLLTGDEVQMNIEEGRRLLLELADEGIGEAQYLAGRAYLEGLWLERDLAKARHMMEQALANGMNQARHYLVWLDRTGNE